MRDFNSSQDLYQFVIELAEAARLRQNDEVAEALEDALKAGMTASDQLGEIRMVMRSTKHIFSGKEYPHHYSIEIEMALKELDRAFRR